jgi:hypothetical protein
MQFLNEPSLLSFVVQALTFALIIPVLYVAYRQARAPEKRHRIRQALAQLGIERSEEIEQALKDEYRLRHYFFPILIATVGAIVLYSTTHPYILKTGVWTGFVEEVISIFGQTNGITNDIIHGRLLFWGWLGAYVYSLNLLIRRFIAYDLTPSVFMYVVGRFVLAWAIGVAVSLGLAMTLRGTGLATDATVTTVFVLIFFIGFFPDSGLDWLTAFSKKFISTGGGIAKETRLSNIEGLSVWHQGRFSQEGIENIQNLAAADIPALVIGTPFTVGQIIDWIDQSILLVYANDDLYNMLEKTGVRCATDFIVASDDATLELLSTASEISASKLKMLRLAVQSAPNIEIVAKYKWQTSLDMPRKEAAKALIPFGSTPTASVISGSPDREQIGALIAEAKV